MPRVPLNRLKQTQENDEAPHEAGTNVAVMTKRIVEARKRAGPMQKAPTVLLGGDIEQSEEDSDDSEGSLHMETTEDEESLSEVLETTTVQKAKKKRKWEKMPDWMEENSDSTEHEEKQLNEANAEGLHDRKRRIGEGAMRNVRQHQQLNIREDAIDKIRTLEEMLQKVNRGKKIRVVVESDDKNNGQSRNTEGKAKHHRMVKHHHQHLSISDEEVTDVRDYNLESEFIVQADVHHVSSENLEAERLSAAFEEPAEENLSLRQDALENKKKDVVLEPAAEECFQNAETGNFGGARPKQKKTGMRDTGAKTAREKINREKRKGHARGKKMKPATATKHQRNEQGRQNEVNWGLDESSECESDGGWDLEGGDIPLLPR